MHPEKLPYSLYTPDLTLATVTSPPKIPPCSHFLLSTHPSKFPGNRGACIHLFCLLSQVWPGTGHISLSHIFQCTPPVYMSQSQIYGKSI